MCRRLPHSPVQRRSTMPHEEDTSLATTGRFSQAVRFWVDEDLLAKLRQEAGDNRVRVSDLARRIIAKHYEGSDVDKALPGVTDYLKPILDQLLEIHLAPLHALSSAAAQQAWAAAHISGHSIAFLYGTDRERPISGANRQAGLAKARKALADARDGGRNFVETVLPGVGDLIDDGTEPLS